MRSSFASKGMRSPSDFLDLWHVDDNADGLESPLAHHSLAYVYPGGEIQVEFVEKTDAYWLRAELPGLQQDDITVRVDGDRLSLHAEWAESAGMGASSPLHRPYRAFARQFKLEEPVEANDWSMTYTDEVLRVRVPKLAVWDTELWPPVMIAS